MKNLDERTAKIIQMASLAAELGWVVAIPQKSMEHLIVGDISDVKIIAAQAESEDYEIFKKETIN